LSFASSIASRLFALRNEERRVSRPAVTIAVWGIAVGLMVMILSVCIVLGFKSQIRQKVVGFGGNIEIINYQSIYNAEAQPIAFSDTMTTALRQMPGVAHVQRFCTKSGMLKTDEAFKGVVFRGVDEDYDTTFLASNLIEGRLPRFSASKGSNEIVLSGSVSRELKLGVGDKVFAYFFSEQVKARRFTVVGIYETHLREFDGRLVFTDLYTTQKLNSWESDQCAGVELLLDDFGDMDRITAELVRSYNHRQDAYGVDFSVQSIKELYPGLFTWLDLIDTNVYVILILMLVLSLFTMVSGLLIIILERTNFIAVMKSLGSTDGQIRAIFLQFATRLVLRGVALGLLLGLGLAFAQKQFHLVRLDAATYYIDTVPIEFSWPLIVLLVVASLIISVLTLIIPTHLVSRIHPARVMRFE